LFIFFASFLLCLFAGRKARPGSDECLTSRHPGLRGPIPRTSTRVASVRTHSAFNRGVVAPLHRSSPCRHCASALVLSLFASPIVTIEGSGHDSRPAQLHSKPHTLSTQPAKQYPTIQTDDYHSP